MVEKADISVSDLDDGGRLSPEQGTGRRCPHGFRFDSASNACVPGEASRQAAWAHAMVPVVYGLHTCGYALMERADEFQPLGNRQSPKHDDPFLADELAVALALSRRTKEQADVAVNMYDEVLSGDNFDEDRFNNVTTSVQKLWEETWDKPTEVAVTAAIVSALATGERKISAGILQGVPSRKAVLDGMVRASKFHTNEFFNTQVMPSLQSQVIAMLEGTPAMGSPDLGIIRAVLDRRLKSVPYWRVVANAATSRSYHYGFLKAAQAQGFRAYRYTAVIDERTSEICTFLDGREWFIADALNIVERVAATDDPEVVKNLAPWPKFADVKDLDGEGLRSLGVIVPPVHGNCRSTIEMV